MIHITKLKDCSFVFYLLFSLFRVLFHLFSTLYLIVSQEVQSSSQSLQEEKEEVKRRLEEATARVIQLEEDLIGVTQKGLQKETELDRWVQGVGLLQIHWIAAFGYIMHRGLYFTGLFVSDGGEITAAH